MASSTDKRDLTDGPDAGLDGFTTFAEFVEQYLETALWAGGEMEPDESMDLDARLWDSAFSVEDFSADARETAESDCRNFLTANSYLLAKAYRVGSYEATDAAHDLFLTRNGHGVGFWDRGLGDVGDQLTTAANLMGEQYLARATDPGEVDLI